MVGIALTNVCPLLYIAIFYGQFCNSQLNIDRLYLYTEINILSENLQVENDTPIDVRNYVKIIDSFPMNNCFAYSIHDRFYFSESNNAQLILSLFFFGKLLNI